MSAPGPEAVEPIRGPAAALLRRITTRPGSLTARSKTTSVRLADDGMSTVAGTLYSRISPD